MKIIKSFAFFIAAGLSVYTQAADIVLGQSADLTGDNKEITAAFNYGAKYVFDSINQSGGIAGKSILLKTLDDKSNQDTAFDNTIRFLDQDRVDILFGYVGDNTSYAAAPMADARNIALFAPVSGLPSFSRDGFSPNTIMTWGDYSAEVERILRHIGQPFAEKNIYIVRDDSYIANELIETIKASLRIKQGKEPVVLDARGANGPADTAAVVTAKELHAIIFLTKQDTTAKVSREIRKRLDYDPLFMLMTSAANLERLQKQDGVARITYTCPVPISNDKLNPAASGFLLNLNTSSAKANPCAAMRGYIAATTLVTALKRTGGNTNPEALKKAVAAQPVTHGKFSLVYQTGVPSPSIYADIGLTNNGVTSR